MILDQATSTVAIKWSLAPLAPCSLPLPHLPRYSLKEREDFPSLTMRFVIAFIRLALFALPVLALEGLLPVKRAEGEVLKDSYIILLKDVPNVARMENITGSIPGSNVTSRWSIVNGFAATLTDDDLNKLRVREDILSISENAVVRTSEKQ